MEYKFDPDKYYRIADNQEYKYEKRGAPKGSWENGDYVTIYEKDAVSGALLNSLRGVSPYNFQEIPTLDGYNPQEIVDRLESLTVEEMLSLVPGPNDSGEAFHIEVTATALYKVKPYNDRYDVKFHISPSLSPYKKWTVSLNDWFGSRDQATFFSKSGDDLKSLISACLLYCASRGFLTKAKLNALFPNE